jgi:hypothetical protein
MTPNDDIRDLAGRYATGSLSEAERNRLFEAALDDQELYDELAQEQEMKQLLDQPGARDRMIRALEPPPKRRSFWIWALVPVTVLSAFAIVYVMRPAKQAPVEVAMQKAPAAAPVQAVSIEPATKEAAPSQAVPSQPATSQPATREAAADQAVASTDAVEKDSKPSAPAAAAPPSPPKEAVKEEALSRNEVKVAAEAAPVVEKAKVASAETERRKQVDPKSAPQPSALSSRAIQKKADALFSPSAGQSQQQNSPGGPRQNVNQAPASAGLVDEQTSALGFHYSLETKGHLTIVPAVDGYLAVRANDGTVMYPSKRTAAGILIDLPLPAGANNVSISFSKGATPLQAASSVRSDVSGAVQGPGDLAVTVKVPNSP